MKNSSFSELDVLKRTPMVCVVPGGHVSIYGTLPWAVFRAEIHVDVHSLGCYWRPCGYPRTMLPQEARWMSVICSTTGVHISVCGLGCCLGPC